LELIEEKGLERGYGGNDFRKHLEEAERQQDPERVATGSKDKRKEAAEHSGPIDLKLIKADPDKLHPLIYFALKKSLKEWEQFMNERPGA
jgi:pre-mRNA-splicing factor 18